MAEARSRARAGRGSLRDGRGRARAGRGARAPRRLEIDRGGPTYTIDTIETLAAENRSGDPSELFLVVGSDVAASLDTWHRSTDLRDAVTLAIVDREDVAPSIPPAGWRAERVHMPRLDVSSTDLRRRIAAGESVEFLVPPPAARILRARGLYTGE